MLSVDNGFTRFMSKLEGRSTPEVKSKWSTRELFAVDVANGREYLESVIDGYTDDLMEAFAWRTTPQGGAYWDLRWNGEVPMNEQDYEFLEALYKAHYG